MNGDAPGLFARIKWVRVLVLRQHLRMLSRQPEHRAVEEDKKDPFHAAGVACSNREFTITDTGARRGRPCSSTA